MGCAASGRARSATRLVGSLLHRSIRMRPSLGPRARLQPGATRPPIVTRPKR